MCCRCSLFKTVFGIFFLFSLLLVSFIFNSIFLNITFYEIYISYYLIHCPSYVILSLYTFFNLYMTAKLNCISKIIQELVPQGYNSGKVLKTPIYEIQFNEIHNVYKDKHSLDRDMKPKFNVVKNTEIITHFQNKNKRTLTSSEIIEKLPLVASIQGRLCDSIQLLNEVFSFQILLTITFMFVFAIFGLFSAYRVFYDSLGMSKVIALNNLSWICYYSLVYVIIIVVSRRTLNAAKKNGIITHKVINKIWDPICISKLVEISEQFSRRVPVLSCGLFPFDWTLLFSVKFTN